MTTMDAEQPIVSERRAVQRREELMTRITNDYREMAGLSLTEAQAKRLFHIEDAQLCRRIIHELVSRGVVKMSEEGLIVRADVSHVPPRF